MASDGQNDNDELSESLFFVILWLQLINDQAHTMMVG